MLNEANTIPGAAGTGITHQPALITRTRSRICFSVSITVNNAAPIPTISAPLRGNEGFRRTARTRAPQDSRVPRHG